jgi:hypothetical protein
VDPEIRALAETVSGRRAVIDYALAASRSRE